MLADPSKLRELASWYREFAERTGNATICEDRLLTAKYLDTEAGHIEVARALNTEEKLVSVRCGVQS
jgi:hypothetical protein